MKKTASRLQTEMAKMLTRLEEVERSSQEAGKPQTELAALKVRSQLLGLSAELFRTEPETGQETEPAALAAIREHLEQLGLAPEGTDLVELARLAAIKVTEK